MKNTFIKLINNIDNLFARLSNNKGSTIIVAIVAMTALCFASASLIQAGSSDVVESTNYIQSSQASYIAMGGIEYAKFKLNNGQDPTVINKPLGKGSFDAQIDLSAKTLTVTGTVAQAETTKNLGVKFSADCFAFSSDYSMTFVQNAGLYINNVGFKKLCHDKVIIDKVIVTWPINVPTQLITKIEYEATTLVYNAITTPLIGSPSNGAKSGTEIDIDNITLIDGNMHRFSKIVMTGPVPAKPQTFTLEVIFKDGSSSVKTLEWE